MPPKQPVREKTVLANIIKYLKTLPRCWFFKVHGGRFQNPGIPDLVGCYDGVFFAIEVKSSTGKPTELQNNVLDAIQSFGGVCGIARNVDDAKLLIEQAVKKAKKKPLT